MKKHQKNSFRVFITLSWTWHFNDNILFSSQSFLGKYLTALLPFLVAIPNFLMHLELFGSYGTMLEIPNLKFQELQEIILKKNQELILAKIGKENAEANANKLQTSVRHLEKQITVRDQEKEMLESNLSQEINILKWVPFVNFENAVDQFRFCRKQIEQLERETKNLSQELVTELQNRIQELTVAKVSVVFASRISGSWTEFFFPE